MTTELSYPFDSEYIIRKKRSIRKNLLSQNRKWIEKRIAILGGSTTTDIKDILELFLLDAGIKPVFYESEFGKYWEEVIFDNSRLCDFKPDLIFIHTSRHNLTFLPSITNSEDEITLMLERQYKHFEQMWNHLSDKYHCPIIQNNMEKPYYRLLGNKDVSDIHGHTNFINRLNAKFYEYAQAHENFFIHDIDYLSSQYGLDEWQNPLYWYMYKYSLCVPAIPLFAYSLSSIIKAIYGLNKKAIVLDLDNTLWGGVIGDDGVEGIQLGPELPMGQAYSDFQNYLLQLKKMGIVLNICSKNDMENAIAGLNHPDSSLSPEDFACIIANWENKDENIKHIAQRINLGLDSLVFIDDNPAEREIVRRNLPDVAVPQIQKIEDYIRIIDHSRFFEAALITQDDINRNEMYKANFEREEFLRNFSSYDDYLKSLEMVATIRGFEPIYFDRIAQLCNKTNQFNLTTKRYSVAEIKEIAENDNYIHLYGTLQDKFGDNGLIGVIIGEKIKDELHIQLWLMSCRVFRRNMEYAMFDRLIEECLLRKIKYIHGYYYPTLKNRMVRDFYASIGFQKIREDDSGNTEWLFKVQEHTRLNEFIKVNR